MRDVGIFVGDKRQRIDDDESANFESPSKRRRVDINSENNDATPAQEEFNQIDDKDYES